MCEKYNCTMSEASCVARYKKMTKQGPIGYERDPGCVSCQTGRGLVEKYKHRKGELMTAPSVKTKGMDAAAELDALEAMVNKKAEKQAQVTERKRCIHCGMEVAMDEAEKHFPKSKLTKDGFEGGCKKCKAQKAKERRHAKRVGLRMGWEKHEPKKNPKKAAAASPKKTVEKVVTEKTDTIKKNNYAPDLGAKSITDVLLENEIYPMDLDETIKQVFKSSGHPHLYESLEKVAFKEMRPPHLQALYMLRGQLERLAAVRDSQ